MERAHHTEMTTAAEPTESLDEAATRRFALWLEEKRQYGNDRTTGKDPGPLVVPTVCRVANVTAEAKAFAGSGADNDGTDDKNGNVTTEESDTKSSPASSGKCGCSHIGQSAPAHLPWFGLLILGARRPD